jgi:hypothetical protein
MSSTDEFAKYENFIRERAKDLAKDAVARLEFIDQLYEMIQIAKADYQKKMMANHAHIAKSKANY